MKADRLVIDLLLGEIVATLRIIRRTISMVHPKIYDELVSARSLSSSSSIKTSNISCPPACLGEVYTKINKITVAAGPKQKTPIPSTPGPRNAKADIFDPEAVSFLNAVPKSYLTLINIPSTCSSPSAH